jgi:predicted nucleotidyltransferase
MRLTTEVHPVICKAITQADAQAQIDLFGSPVDDAARGGDIDLLVLSSKIHLTEKLDILAQLHQSLGERKIDLAVYPDANRLFARMVMQDGVSL